MVWLVEDEFRRGRQSDDLDYGYVTAMSEVVYEFITSTELCDFVYSLHFCRATILSVFRTLASCQTARYFT